MSRRTRPRRRVRQRLSWRERAGVFVPLRSWRVQLVGAVLAVAAAVVSAQSFASAREAAGTYLIQPGDTLLSIASTTGVPLDKLVNVNGIANPDLIIAGQTLSLDGQPAPSPTSGGGRYTVKAGDTLWDISVATGVSLETLIKLNDVPNADNLAIGQVLQVPAVAATQRVAGATATPRTAPTASPTPKPNASAKPAVAAQQGSGTATAARAAAGAANALAQRVTSEAQRIGGPNVRVGAAALNLASGAKLSVHADETFPSASVMKLPILVELERQIAAGTLSWNDSLRTDAAAMIAVSDNNAANRIAAVVKPQAVNDTMARLGLGGTRFLNLFSDTRTAGNPGLNQTTPANMARLLELIETDQIVNSQVSIHIRTLLARNTDRSKLARLLPPDTRLAHKSGWYEGVANDVGIVVVDRVPTRWVIAVFAENVPDSETGNQVVAAVSKAVYDAWAP